MPGLAGKRKIPISPISADASAMSYEDKGKFHVDVLELESSAAIFHAGLSRLGRLVERLEGRVEVLEHENYALKSCLEATKTVRPDAFYAQVHRRRFASTLSRHPCDWDVTLPDLLLTREFRLAIGSFASWPTVRRCGGLDRNLRELIDKIPPMVFLCGGFDGKTILASVDKFDPSKQCSNPCQDASPSTKVSSCVGGWKGAPEEDAADMLGQLGVQDPWEPAAPMAQRRAGFAAAACSGLIYVCGGYDGDVLLETAERFHPAPGQGFWEPIPSMVQKRHSPSAAALGGRLYVCGGFNGEKALSSIECYDPSSGLWEPGPPMRQRRHGAAAAVLDGKLYVCGGYDGAEALLSAERYDPEKGEWEDLPDMQHRRNVAFAAGIEGKLYVGSGCDGQDTLNATECFDPVLHVWEPGTPMSQRRHGAASAVAKNSVFILGGGDIADAAGSLLATVEAFDPLESQWKAAMPMPNARMDMAAVSLYAPL